MISAPPDSPSDPSQALRPPHALAMFDFARQHGALHGSAPLADMPRLRDLLSAADGLVTWSLHGEMRQRPGLPAQPIVTLRVQAGLSVICQRCLHEMQQAIDETVQFRLVLDEPELTQDELDAEEEALVARHPVDVGALIEDQLILALPLVPMHDVCTPGVQPQGSAPLPEDGQSGQRQTPFAQLRDLLEASRKR